MFSNNHRDYNDDLGYFPAFVLPTLSHKFIISKNEKIIFYEDCWVDQLLRLIDRS